MEQVEEEHNKARMAAKSASLRQVEKRKSLDYADSQRLDAKKSILDAEKIKERLRRQGLATIREALASTQRLALDAWRTFAITQSRAKQTAKKAILWITESCAADQKMVFTAWRSEAKMEASTRALRNALGRKSLESIKQALGSILQLAFNAWSEQASASAHMQEIEAMAETNRQLEAKASAPAQLVMRSPASGSTSSRQVDVAAMRSQAVRLGKAYSASSLRMALVAWRGGNLIDLAERRVAATESAWGTEARPLRRLLRVQEACWINEEHLSLQQLVFVMWREEVKAGQVEGTTAQIVGSTSQILEEFDDGALGTDPKALKRLQRVTAACWVIEINTSLQQVAFILWKDIYMLEEELREAGAQHELAIQEWQEVHEKQTEDLRVTHERILKETKATHERRLVEYESRCEIQLRESQIAHERQLKDCRAAVERQLKGSSPKAAPAR